MQLSKNNIVGYRTGEFRLAIQRTKVYFEEESRKKFSEFNYLLATEYLCSYDLLFNFEGSRGGRVLCISNFSRFEAEIVGWWGRGTEKKRANGRSGEHKTSFHHRN